MERIQENMEKGTRRKQPEEEGRNFWGFWEEMDILVSPVRTVSCPTDTECPGHWPLGLRATCVGKKALPIPKRGWGAGMLLCRGPLRTLHVSDCCGAKSRARAFQACTTQPKDLERISCLMEISSDYTWFSKESKNGHVSALVVCDKINV